MAIKSIEELMEMVNKRVGDNNDDETLSFIADISDTLNNYKSISEDTTNWKQKYEENDNEWREKYKARFFNPEKVSDADNNKKAYDEDEPAVLTYDKLFKEE